MNKCSNSARSCNHRSRRVRAAIAIGIVLAAAAFVFSSRGSSDLVLAVDLAGERCEFTNMFVGDQLIRVGTSCHQLAHEDSGPGRKAGVAR